MGCEEGKPASIRLQTARLLVLCCLALLALLFIRDHKLHYRGRSLWSTFERNMKGEAIQWEEHWLGVKTRQRARATLLILARNEDIEGVLASMAELERRFNSKFGYPYVFLNNGEFSESFKARTQKAATGLVHFGRIPEEAWGYPSWVERDDALAAQHAMQRRGVLYAGRESYHHMCRFYSGFFQHHPLLAPYDYYWRIEPGVHYYCDLDYDPFLFMQKRSLKYGFVLAVVELASTIPTLWATILEFRKENPGDIPADNLLDFVTAKDGGYNLCHFWSNFEIGDLNFFRSRQYQMFFDYLDRKGGFYMERWGDAPVHTLAIALFLNSSQVHFFKDIGYRHNSMAHCPAVMRNKCSCHPMTAVSFHKPSYGRCHKQWDGVASPSDHSRRPP